MKKFVSQFPYTFAGMVCGLVLVILAVTLELEVFEALVKLIEKGEAFELDEVIVPLTLIGLGLCCDFVTRIRAEKGEEARLALYNQMSEEMMYEISVHLSKLLEFRKALLVESKVSHDIRHELDRMIVNSFNHFERIQRRSNVGISLLPLVSGSSEFGDLGIPTKSDTSKPDTA